MSKVLIAFCAFLMFVITPSVNADPLVITGGSLTVTDSIGGANFTFITENFSITGGRSDRGNSGPQSCFNCLSGNLLSVNSLFAGSSLGMGTLTMNGITSNLVFTGTIEILGDPVVIPFATTDVTITAPFTVSARIFGCDVAIGSLNCGQSVAIFSTELVGQGIATIELDFFELNRAGQAQFFFRSVTYTFQNGEIPEPLTIVLLTTGLIGLGAKLRSNGRAK